MFKIKTVTAIFLVCIALFAWTPTIQTLSTPNADQISEQFLDLTLICSDKTEIGWVPGISSSNQKFPSLFTPVLTASILKHVVCKISSFFNYNSLVVYLITGQAITWILAYISMRWAGFCWQTSQACSFLMVTAPCSFSRVGHLGLSFMIPVIPTIIACLMIHRFSTDKPIKTHLKYRHIVITGIASCMLSYPFNEYYIAFSVLLLFFFWLYELITASPGSLSNASYAMRSKIGLLFGVGYTTVLLLLFSEKFLSIISNGVPTSWSSVRFASEQFRYGLLPLTWFIPSPWVSTTLETLQNAGINTASESYFWSMGSLLIPIGWVSAIRRLSQSPRQDQDRRYLALLLLLTTALGLICMTMGGLGTLFAATVSPVLRSLNRFTVFVYGAAVMYLLAEFDFWLRHREQNR